MTIKKFFDFSEASIFVFLSIISVNGSSQIITDIQSDNKLSSNIDTVIHNSVSQFFVVESRVGVSMAMFYKGDTFFYNYGSKEKGKMLLPTQNTIYEIGSITKTFGGLLLSQAVLDKKVKLDDDIRIHLDEKYPNLEYKGIPIKLYQLLNHSSGLPYDFINRDRFEKHNSASQVHKLAEIENNYSREQLFKDLHTVRLDTIPGIKLSYSNVAAQLLSFILEKVYRMPYPILISKYVTAKFCLHNTAFQFPEGQIENIAKGYNESGLKMPRINSGAAGGLLSTTQDLLEYGKLHLNEDNPVVKLTHEATWGQIQYYAMGLNWQMQQKPEGFRRIWQSGSTAGFTSLLSMYPDIGIVFVFLTNEHDEDSEGALSKIEQNILSELNDN